MFEHHDAFDEQSLPYNPHQSYDGQFPGSYVDDPPGWCNLVPEGEPHDTDSLQVDLSHDDVATCDTSEQTDEPDHVTAPVDAVGQAWIEVKERGAQQDTPAERPLPGHRPIRSFFITDDKRLLPVAAPHVDQYAAELFNGTREAVLQKFTSDPGNTDMDRCASYLQNLGLSVSDTVLILPESQRQAVSDALNPVGDRINPDYAAAYSGNTDIVIAFQAYDRNGQRDTQREEWNIVHEFVHSAGAREIRAIGDRERLHGIGTSRSGHQVRGLDGRLRGTFFEEGVADYIAGQYCADQLGKPHGLDELPDAEYTIDQGHYTVRVPSLYVSFNDNGEPRATPSGFAATAIGHLVEKDPELLPAFIHGSSDVEAKREMIGRLEAIDKGLYVALRRYFTDYDWLSDGLVYVRNTLGLPHK